MRRQFLVWDPISGVRRRVDFPPVLADRTRIDVQSGTVLRLRAPDQDARDDGGFPLFQIVLVGINFVNSSVAFTLRRPANGAISSLNARRSTVRSKDYLQCSWCPDWGFTLLVALWVLGDSGSHP
uniref:Uncharacterized protein n=1 Tax=Leersia perrieri TaxID=77586 RepID=A0A0D9VEA7_9ORYZ